MTLFREPAAAAGERGAGGAGGRPPSACAPPAAPGPARPRPPRSHRPARRRRQCAPVAARYKGAAVRAPGGARAQRRALRAARAGGGAHAAPRPPGPSQGRPGHASRPRRPSPEARAGGTGSARPGCGAAGCASGAGARVRAQRGSDTLPPLGCLAPRPGALDAQRRPAGRDHRPARGSGSQQIHLLPAPRPRPVRTAWGQTPASTGHGSGLGTEALAGSPPQAGTGGEGRTHSHPPLPPKSGPSLRAKLAVNWGPRGGWVPTIETFRPCGTRRITMGAVETQPPRPPTAPPAGCAPRGSAGGGCGRHLRARRPRPPRAGW